MLPKYFVNDDEKWLREQLSLLPAAYVVVAVREYEKVFIEHYTAEQAPHRKQQSARFNANTRLRKYVQAVIAKLNQ